MRAGQSSGVLSGAPPQSSQPAAGAGGKQVLGKALPLPGADTVINPGLEEEQAFGGTAIVRSEPKTNLMSKFNQRPPLAQRVAEESRRLSAGLSQHQTFADDIMPAAEESASASEVPDTPADIERLSREEVFKGYEYELVSRAGQEDRQLQTAGGMPAQLDIPRQSAAPAGLVVSQKAYTVEHLPARAHAGFGGGGGGSSSRSSPAWDTPLHRAECSAGSSGLLGSAQVHSCCFT